MKTYYVYELIDPKDCRIFYVGKGKKNRMYRHVADVKHGKIPNNNRHLYHKIKQILESGNSVMYNQIFFTNNNEEAYKMEDERIKDLGLHNLCNIMESSSARSESSYRSFGKKMVGRVMSEETRSKIGQSLMGHFTSEITKQKISDTKKGVKIGPCSELRRIKIAEARRPKMGFKKVKSPSGIIYSINVLEDFCKEHNLRSSSMSELLKGKYKHHRGWSVLE